MKETEDSTNDYTMLLFWKEYIVKVTTLNRAIYRFSAITNEITMVLFTGLEQII